MAEHPGDRIWKRRDADGQHTVAAVIIGAVLGVYVSLISAIAIVAGLWMTLEVAPQAVEGRRRRL